MARGWSGSRVRGPVVLPDMRVGAMRELLLDLSRSGVCVVLGAGASHGVVPMTAKQITGIAWKMVQAQGSFQALSSEERRQLARHPEKAYLTSLLQSMPTGSWDRFVLDHLSPGRSVLILSDIFSPRDVP